MKEKTITDLEGEITELEQKVTDLEAEIERYREVLEEVASSTKYALRNR